jgi:hypothetical protein
MKRQRQTETGRQTDRDSDRGAGLACVRREVSVLHSLTDVCAVAGTWAITDLRPRMLGAGRRKTTAE